MTRKQKATYLMLAINTILVNVVYFTYFYHGSFSTDLILEILSISLFTVVAHFCILMEHVFLQYLIPTKEPILLKNEKPLFMENEHFYYDDNYQICLSEKTPPELIKEVNDYILSYNKWFAVWKSNNKRHNTGGDFSERY